MALDMVYTTLLIHALTIRDLVKEVLHGGAPEGRGSNQHLIEYDSHRPPVNGVAVGLSENHLGGDVIGRAIDFRVTELPVT